MFRLWGERPLLLNSVVTDDNVLLAVDMTNPDAYDADGRVILPHGAIHFYRSKFLWRGACHEVLQVKNLGMTPVTLDLTIGFDADFADIFEVRGQERATRGTDLEPEVSGDTAVLGYRGLDRLTRLTRITFHPAPEVLEEHEACYELRLNAKQEAEIQVRVCCEGCDVWAPNSSAEALSDAIRQRSRGRHGCRVTTTNEQFNDWLNRSEADLEMMVSDMPTGPYPFGGVPWFSTPFGRDGLITALECLAFDYHLAEGVLAYLASTQATDVDPARDAEPGKILHETRRGEMAVLGEVPFGRYYGSVDSTPLFLLLAGKYYERTGDLAFLKSIWPNIRAALDWCDTYGDKDGDGFIEYSKMSKNGLEQQGWKDSQDSVFHASGELAGGPIALCEVQGYLYAARIAIAKVADTMAEHDLASQLREQAARLAVAFEDRFWCDDLSIYALALDGNKKPCRVITSNAGQVLFSGIARTARAVRAAETLMLDESFSGWGVRTVASQEIRFNPMSYHDGSVWPHDNALVAAGLARYGRKTDVARILTGLFDASLFVDLHRLPELFCGFRRRRAEGPTLYPVACAPQSWAAAAVYSLLESCLGLRVSAPEQKITLHYPILPESLRRVHISHLQVGDSHVDLSIERHHDTAAVSVTRREGRLDVETIN
jgi:glycogen debranching enzyme